MATIITKNGSGSAVPASLTQGELAINVDTGRLFYGSGSGNAVRTITASLATTASYVNLLAGPNITINYQNNGIAITGSGGGGGTPGGANTTIQFNDGGTFSGSGNFTFNKNTNAVILTGSLLATQSFISKVDYIDYTVDPGTLAHSEGRTYWDVDRKTLQIDTDVNNFTISAGHVSVLRGRNTNSYTLTKGTVVYINGNSGQFATFTSASWENDPSSAYTIGLIAQDINANQFGYAVTDGEITGVNTNGFAPATLLYLSSSGQYTGTKPVAPNHTVRLGQVVVASTNGILQVKIDNGYELGELHDVLDNTTTSSYGDLLVKSGSVWHNSRQLTGSYAITGSLQATSFTGSLFGTASWAQTASNALTASYISTLNQNVIISGSAAIGSSSLGPFENTLTLGPRDTISEGGQLGLNAPGGTYTSASMIDNYQNQIRILHGTNASSAGLVAQWNLHTLQMQLPAYTNASSFAGTATANLAVDSSGNIITVSTAGGTVFPYVGDAVITGSLTTTGIIFAKPNGGMYFQGGDDAALYDINVANHIGIYGVQDSSIGSIKLGSGGGIISGKDSRIGIGTTAPISGTLEVNGNVYAASFTGSLQGTASYALTASFALNGGGGGATILKKENITFASSSWVSQSLYVYTYTDIDIAASSSIVDFTPNTASFATVVNAIVYPTVVVTAGSASFFATNQPANDITGELVITNI